MVYYHASNDSSCYPAAHTATSLGGGVHNFTLDSVDRLALLASTACRVPRASKSLPFDDLCPEMVPLLIAALCPITSWYKRDVDSDLASSSSFLEYAPDARRKDLKGNCEGQSTAMPNSGSVSSDDEDEINNSECALAVRDTNREVLPLPTGAQQPEPVRVRERYLKSLLQPRHLPGDKYRKTVEERLQFLQRDPWIEVKSVGRQRVVCNQCRESVKLDSRGNAAYYPNAWLRHRRRCLEIYRTWLTENGYDDPTWIQNAERRRNARLRMSLKRV
ncbi:hypothetical protein IW261DRAFT_1512487 [Armillaria novae-zelandiae]|uniref:Uncharacterized protein n=1 Tax=Armillaria novae-zelandiae TaxID=153914 RepID=A0AA39NT10_9AGAR|nr:hypothetical protein IW261DRAFT_1512487 [Armillaria novae-zelandiae]